MWLSRRSSAFTYDRDWLNENGDPILSVLGGLGGMSGPGTKQIGREQLAMWVEQTGGDREIISTLGVHTGRELGYRVERGAVMAGGVTFLWESEDWGDAVTKMLTGFVEYEEQGEA